MLTTEISLNLLKNIKNELFFWIHQVVLVIEKYNLLISRKLIYVIIQFVISVLKKG